MDSKKKYFLILPKHEVKKNLIFIDVLFLLPPASCLNLPLLVEPFTFHPLIQHTEKLI